MATAAMPNSKLQSGRQPARLIPTFSDWFRSGITIAIKSVAIHFFGPDHTHTHTHTHTHLCSCCLCLSWQVFVERLISRYRSMRRPRITCWFARTALSPPWYETADRRSTAPASARRSRKTSAAGELRFLSLSLNSWIHSTWFHHYEYYPPHSSSPTVRT